MRAEFDFASLTWRLLLQLQLAEVDVVHGLERLRLTKIALGQLDNPLSSPAARIESIYIASMLTLEALAGGGVQHEQIKVYLQARGFAIPEIDECLRYLEQRNYIITNTDCFELNPEVNHRLIIPPAADERRRLGLWDFVDRMGQFFETMATCEDDSLIGQRTLTFRVRPIDLFGFIRRHREQVVAECTELELSAANATDALVCSMSWAIFPRPVQGSEAGDDQLGRNGARGEGRRQSER